MTQMYATADIADGTLYIFTGDGSAGIETNIAVEASFRGKIFPVFAGPRKDSYRIRLYGTFQIVWHKSLRLQTAPCL